MSNSGNYYGSDWSGIEWQVEKFLDLHPRISAKTLIAYQAGGCKDFFNEDRADASLVASTNAKNLRRLAKAGARAIIVGDIYDCSFPPGLKNSPESQKKFNELTTAGNQMLGDEIESIRGEFPKFNICLFSFQQAIQKVLVSGAFKEGIYDHQERHGARRKFSVHLVRRLARVDCASRNSSERRE